MPDLDDLLHAAVADLGARSGPARSGWRTPSPTRSRAASTSSSRRAPAPASPSPTSCPRSRTRWRTGRPSSSRPRRSPCRARSSTATCRGWPRPSPPSSAAARPSRSSRAGATTSARTSWPAASPTRTRCSSAPSGSTPRCRLARPRRRRVREWAEETETGDRDDLVPGVSERVWRAHSVSAEECLGQRCPMVAECFVELARAAARDVDVVVTNHSFMAIDAFEGRQMLPEHDVLVVDEGHELVDRVTSTITDELWPGASAARRSAPPASSTPPTGSRTRPRDWGASLEATPEGRLTGIPDALALALAQVRDAARSGAERGQARRRSRDRRRPAGRDGRARRALRRRRRGSSRSASSTSCGPATTSGAGTSCSVAPMSVALLLRDKLFTDRTVVLTSATLELGGSFDTVAGTIGLRGEGSPTWQGLDVGSPFDYRQQAIAYVATHLPPPGRDGLPDAFLDEIERSCGPPEGARSDSSRRCGPRSRRRRSCGPASTGDERGITVLCQGEDQMTTLVRAFATDPRRLPVRDAHALAGGRRARARPASSSSSTVSRSRGRTTRSPRRAPRPSPSAAATGSCRSPHRTPRCASPRVPGGSSAGPTTEASSPSSTTG
jgi:hypothetical protein